VLIPFHFLVDFLPLISSFRRLLTRKKKKSMRFVEKRRLKTSSSSNSARCVAATFSTPQPRRSFFSPFSPTFSGILLNIHFRFIAKSRVWFNRSLHRHRLDETNLVGLLSFFFPSPLSHPPPPHPPPNPFLRFAFPPEFDIFFFSFGARCRV
jgi:hypothetical protein